MLRKTIIIDKMIEMNYFYKFAKDNLIELGFANLDRNENMQSNKYYIIFLFIFRID